MLAIIRLFNMNTYQLVIQVYRLLGSDDDGQHQWPKHVVVVIYVINYLTHSNLAVFDVQTHITFTISDNTTGWHTLRMLYMFRTVFPSIIRSSRLHIQQQAYVKQLLLRAASGSR
jgi:hypothetical protein